MLRIRPLSKAAMVRREAEEKRVNLELRGKSLMTVALFTPNYEVQELVKLFHEKKVINSGCL